MLDKLAAAETRYDQLMAEMADPAIQADTAKFRTHSKELSDLEPLVDRSRAYTRGADPDPGGDRAAAGSGHARAGAGRAGRARAAARGAGHRAQAAAHSERPQRRQERRARDSRRHRRRRSRALRVGPVPDVLALRRASGLEVRGAEPQRDRGRRHQGSHRVDRGQGRLRQAEVRERRPPRAAGAGDRGQRPHPYLHRDRRGAAGSRGSRHPDRRQGPAHRHLLLERSRRSERQHDLLGGADHPPPHRRRRVAAGRKVADQEPARRR